MGGAFVWPTVWQAKQLVSYAMLRLKGIYWFRKWTFQVIVFIYLLEDLWESLENASGKPIAAVMNTWTKQMGFPLIYVEAEQVNL